MARSKGIYADLHVHTYFSDSSLSPTQAVEEAVKRGVGVFAIADHEGFEGSREARPLAKAAGIDFIPAAELECTEDGRQLHVLCYGANADEPALKARAAENRRLLDAMSEVLMDRMREKYPQLSREGLNAYEYDRSLGGWKCLHYLVEMGVTAVPKEGIAFYERYGIRYETAGFGSLQSILAAIHGAGGRAVLAHPGYSLRSLPADEIECIVRGLVGQGLDGLECYYPLHSPELTSRFLGICDEKNLLITAGSDCHGSFGHSEVNEMRIERDRLRLDDLIGK